MLMIVGRAGGLSFLSSQWGWSVNSLVGVEMVLANGTIVQANDNLNSGKQQPLTQTDGY